MTHNSHSLARDSKFGRESIQYWVGKTHCQGHQHPSKRVPIFPGTQEANSKMVPINPVPILPNRTVLQLLKTMSVQDIHQISDIHMVLLVNPTVLLHKCLFGALVSFQFWCIWCGIFGPHEPPQVSPLTSRWQVSHWAWIEPGEWLSTTKLQSKRSNPNARRQLGDLMEADPSPPNHRVNKFLTYPRQAAIRGQDWGSALTVVPQGAHAYVKLQ